MAAHAKVLCGLVKIATGVLNANLSAYLYWEGVEVNQQQASSYLVLSDGTNTTPSGHLWAFAMWSRFIRPGAYRISTSGTVSNVVIGAFKNADGSLAVVLTNTGSATQSVKLAFSGFTPSAAAAYLTDNSHTVATTSFTLSGGAVTASVPAHSILTVKLTGGGANSISLPSTASSTLPTTSVSQAPPPTTLAPTTTASGGGGAIESQYGQCGGSGWSGPTTCQAPYACSTLNPYYAQCLYSLVAACDLDVLGLVEEEAKSSLPWISLAAIGNVRLSLHLLSISSSPTISGNLLPKVFSSQHQCPDHGLQSPLGAS